MLCNGSTNALGAFSLGSNPSAPTSLGFEPVKGGRGKSIFPRVGLFKNREVFKERASRATGSSEAESQRPDKRMRREINQRFKRDSNVKFALQICTLRVSYIGITLAFQANERGSTPLTRSE